MTVKFVSKAKLPTAFAEFTIYGFEDDATGKEHVALVLGDLESTDADAAPLLCRLHSECLTGDAMFSLRCDCGPQLETAMKAIADEGRGLILYLRQEGRGIGLLNKIKAYALQDSGADTVEANLQLGFEPDSRDYQICVPMLEYFKVDKLRLMTNNPRKVDALRSAGIDVTEIVPIHTGINSHNEDYLAVKVSKLGHIQK